MKPIYVVLIALASALAGGIIGLFIGSAAGGVAGGYGGLSLGSQAGVCIASDITKNQKTLTPAQAEQLVKDSFAQIKGMVNKVNADNFVNSNGSECQKTVGDFKSLASK